MDAPDKGLIDVDQVMARIRETLRTQRESGQKRPGVAATGLIERALSLALKLAYVSNAPLHGQSAVQRTLVRPIAKLFLRLAPLERPTLAPRKAEDR